MASEDTEVNGLQGLQTREADSKYTVCTCPQNTGRGGKGGLNNKLQSNIIIIMALKNIIVNLCIST